MWIQVNLSTKFIIIINKALQNYHYWITYHQMSIVWQMLTLYSIFVVCWYNRICRYWLQSVTCQSMSPLCRLWILYIYFIASISALYRYSVCFLLNNRKYHHSLAYCAVLLSHLLYFVRNARYVVSLENKYYPPNCPNIFVLISSKFKFWKSQINFISGWNAPYCAKGPSIVLW